MSTERTSNDGVIARLDRAIQHAAAIVFSTTAGVYSMPACAGMTLP
ncbi:hypothetical protein [Bradyrhizobium sp. SZCCHNS1054]|nr:hypothetical protein [Bradyrhizobium sp. SZCCHNS1054]